MSTHTLESWTALAGRTSPRGQAFINGEFVASKSNKTIKNLNPATGESLWSWPFKTMYDVNAACAIVSDGKVFISSGVDQNSELLDISKGKPVLIWKNKNLRNHLTSSVLWKGYLYGVDDVSVDEYDLKCVDWATGELKWAEPKLGGTFPPSLSNRMSAPPPKTRLPVPFCFFIARS